MASRLLSKRTMRKVLLAVALLASSACGGGGGGGPSTPDGPSGPPGARLEATRTSGTAPLAVLFDATGTTSDTAGLDTFRQITYSFDFGDDRGQTWAVSGLPKNTQTGGPLAAHVFDVPGTYVVSLHTVEKGGAKSETSVTVVVDDPDTVYAGTKTICVSPTSAYEGCPAGAAHATALPTAPSWSGLRVLLHRGESFGEVYLGEGNSGIQIGAYGTGAKPKLDGGVRIGTFRPSTAAFATDITVMDLDVQGELAQALGSRVLFYRNDTVHAVMSMGADLVSYWGREDPWRIVPESAFYNAREIFLVENYGVGEDLTIGGSVYGSGSRVALLGNTFGRRGQHSVRTTALERSVIAHNELQGISGDGNRHALKLHSGGLKPYADGFVPDKSSGWASSRIVIADNLFGNAEDNNDWTVAICPTNGGLAEGIENVIIENNRFKRGLGTDTNLILGGRNITYRGNSVVGGGAISVGHGHDQSLPDDWKGPYFAE